MFQDLRFGLRMLLKNRGFALIAALTLGLGIGANTGVFSVAYTTLLRPLPFREQERLVVATLTGRGEPEQIHSARVSADFFPALGVKPSLGRAFRRMKIVRARRASRSSVIGCGRDVSTQIPIWSGK